VGITCSWIQVSSHICITAPKFFALFPQGYVSLCANVYVATLTLNVTRPLSLVHTSNFVGDFLLLTNVNEWTRSQKHRILHRSPETEVHLLCFLCKLYSSWFVTRQVQQTEAVPPWKYSKRRTSRGVIDRFCLRYLPSDESWRIELNAKEKSPTKLLVWTSELHVFYLEW
jgi:hypothetical protein